LEVIGGKHGGRKLQRLDLLPEDMEDLVHTIEASFAISLTQRELRKAKSIGGLADCVSQKMSSPRTSRCLSSVVFYRLRQTFNTSFKIPPAAIKTETPLHTLMPWVTRRKGWHEVQHALQVELPQLLYPVWVIVSSIIITGLVFWAEWLRIFWRVLSLDRCTQSVSTSCTNVSAKLRDIRGPCEADAWQKLREDFL
jgi:hypothetical protein